MTKAIGSPGKYIQGSGELGNLKSYVEAYGKNIFILADQFIFTSEYIEIIEKGFENTDLNLFMEKFHGETSINEINRVKTICQKTDSAVIIGIGGGKTIDTAKATAHNLGLPVVVVPTAASTDAPCSALSVIYTDKGVFSHIIKFRQNPEIVLVDTDVVASAPVRLLVSGMGDALSTYIEARANYESNSDNFVAGGKKCTNSALALAKLSFDTLIEDGLKAKLAVENKVCTKAVENIIEANTYLSGIGFESTGCAAAHSINDGFTVLEECHHLYHGEKVAFGTICELVLENRSSQEIGQVIKFCISVGLPVTLEDMGLKQVNSEDIIKVAKAACAEGQVIYAEPFEIKWKLVYDAIIATDAIGKMYKNGKIK